ncbi:MAG: cysteine synthase A [Acidimicrobiales bacterium]|nr:cysteine synthase A [Hyphomonadaceae bacterium]RZV44733.1 MAG: cysteine synthase A [Acidimicrobiales bacterium]
MAGKKPGRGKIYDSIIDTIGDTPLVRLPKTTKGAKADLLYKLEFFNPGASVKDRIAMSMVESLEASGKLKKGGTIVEPTSGNTGIGLALVAAAKGYKAIFTMPESMSIERRKLMKLLGAEIVLTPPAGGMPAAIEKANELVAQIKGAVQPGQFNNPANPEIHRRTTGPEIWNDTGGQVDVLISGVGTGGTLTGAGSFLKKKNPDLKIIAIEPEGSPFLSKGEKGPHMIQGIGAGFKPDILETELIDDIVRIDNDTAFETARKAAAKDGAPVGISSGAAIAASLKIAKRKAYAGKTIVTIIPSFAERYMSTALFDF